MTWKYLDVLNECIKILLTIGLGSLLGYLQMLQAQLFVPQATKFVFNIALPCLVVQGLGIGMDFYNDTLLWNFFGAYLALRAIALVASLILVAVDRSKGIGDVAVYWLSFTWISTVILGVPISTAVFGNPQLGFKYGILAGVSSFIFQLPLQLFFLECHTLNESAQEPTKDDEIQDETKIDDVITDKKSPNGSEELEESDIEKNGEDDVGAESNMQEMPKFPSSRDDNKVQQDEAVTKLSWLKMLRSGDVWRKITLNVLQNPVLWAIAVGFILTLSTVGPRFLNPNGTDYVPGLGWIFITLSWMGDCVSPVSLFAMGVWMQKEWKSLFAIPVWSACLYMISKLVLVPLIMVFLAMAVHLDDQSARAAVLISSLPISLASFVLASRYKIGEAILSENVALGTILILPTVLIWNMVLDEVGVFLIPENGL